MRDPAQLLGDDLALEPTLRRQVDVLEVATAAGVGAGSGQRAGRRDPVGGGGQHLDGVASQEPRADLPLGQRHDDALARQAVADEDDGAGRLAGVGAQARDPEAAVAEALHVDGEALTDQRATSRGLGSGASPTTPAAASTGAAAQSSSSLTGSA